jgi:uncharacterized protein
VNEVDTKGFTPLHMAAAQNFTSISDRLLVGGAAIDPPDKKDRTPLLLAARAGHVETVQLLLGTEC